MDRYNLKTKFDLITEELVYKIAAQDGYFVNTLNTNRRNQIPKKIFSCNHHAASYINHLATTQFWLYNFRAEKRQNVHD